MPKQTVQSQATDQDRFASDNFLVIHDQCLQEWVCDELMIVNDKAPLVKMIQTDHSKFMAENKMYWSRTHKYEHQGRIHCNIPLESLEFEYIMERVNGALPKGWHFGSINYVQIIEYTEGSHFPWHMDEADDSDTGTAIIMLNDTFIGGQLNVAGHRFLTKQGTIVAFNNSTRVWHNVEPIIKGSRYCLAIWFGPPHEEEEENAD